MNKNSKKELVEEALRFMALRSELFKDRPSAAEFLMVSEDTVAKWERAERRIDRRAWRDLERLKGEQDEREVRLSQRTSRCPTIHSEQF